MSAYICASMGEEEGKRAPYEGWRLKAAALNSEYHVFWAPADLKSLQNT